MELNIECSVVRLLMQFIYITGGLGSSVSILTGCRLDGPGIQSWWGRDFPYLSRLALEPTQLPVQWVPVLSRVAKRPRRGVDHPPPSSAVVKKE